MPGSTSGAVGPSCAPVPTAPVPMSAVPGYSSSRPGVQVGIQLPADASEEQIRFARQLGVEWVMTSVDDPARQDAATYRAVARRFADNGLKVYRLANHSCHNMEEVTLGLPGRDQKVREYLAYIRALGEAGIRYATYAHMANGIWSTGREPIRGGATGRALRLDRAEEGRWIRRTYQAPLTHGRRYTEGELWENYERFIRQVVPVAEEAGVRIGIHPDDPPVYELGGIPRCVFGTFDGYRRALEIAASPSIGVCLCIGCWLEGGPAMGADVVSAIRWFGGRGQLFKVHFRNVTAPLPEGFVETFLDDGYMDMAQAMRALVEVGFDGCVISDHGHEMVGGRYASEAFAIGTITGLVAATRAPAAPPGA
jgi:mannonate dehydratase